MLDMTFGRILLGWLCSLLLRSLRLKSRLRREEECQDATAGTGPARLSAGRHPRHR
jgi:hypothetical protein